MVSITRLTGWILHCPSFLVLLVLLLESAPTNGHATSKPQEQQQQNLRSLQEEPDNSTATVPLTTCPPCPQCTSEGEEEHVPWENPSPPLLLEQEQLTMQILVVDSPGIITMVKWNADDYYQFTNGRVNIEIKLAPTMPELFSEIEQDARAGGSLYDAYYTNPVVLGTAAMLKGFLDLTPYVKSSPYADWIDVLPALRHYVTSFEDKIYIVLLDGDTHSMFYRKDILTEFGLKVPRTWNEYTEVAKAVHGKVYQNQTLSGSCISRIQGDHAMYWYHLVLSTITQTQGTHEGSLFDSSDMTPLTGEAMAEMLQIHEEQSKYGSPDEYTDIINHVQNGRMNEGSCVMTFMWGDLFRRSNAQGSILHDNLGIAPTPGSDVVLDRETGRLAKCTRERCPYAIYYDDIGFVNSAPYAANGGWGAAVSAHTTPEKQKALAEFFLWASSREQSQQYVIPNATLPWDQINGQDPWRKSQLDVDQWVARGFNRDVSKQYVESILNNLVSENVVVEARFPKAGEIMGVLDKQVNLHLVAALEQYKQEQQMDPSDTDAVKMTEEEKHQARLKTALWITDQWNQIIRRYNARGDTVAPILEVYQRLRGVYVPQHERNHLNKIRPFGLTLMAIIMASSVGAAVWVFVMRHGMVVKASQPPFLWLICFGTLVMGSSIYTMGVDDGIASIEGCNAACQITPWFVAVGFAMCFSALAAKILRLKILKDNADQFRRIEVKVRDVLLPFCGILLLNTVFLLIWTLVDPLRWERVNTGRTESGDPESYGRCVSDGKTSMVMIGLIAGINAVAILLANVLAYQTRRYTVAFHESKFVALAMASILQAMLIGTPLMFLADSNPTAKYVVRSVLVFVVCMSVLVFIFVPKIMKQHRGTKEEYRFSAQSRVRESSLGFRSSEFLSVPELRPSYCTVDMIRQQAALQAAEAASSAQLQGAGSDIDEIPVLLESNPTTLDNDDESTPPSTGNLDVGGTSDSNQALSF